jgi:indole-3-glycerol phosphate synthase
MANNFTLERTSILKDILENKRAEVKAQKAIVPLGELKKSVSSGLPDTVSFIAAIEAKGVSIIAEVKKASPSKGVIREDFDPVEVARIYDKNGASALSVLTDERYFQGSLESLKAIRKITTLPILRKDFIVDLYQIYESRIAGADAVLLIVGVLAPQKLKEFISLTTMLGMDALVEVRTEENIAVAIEAGARIIGVNNRDLKTFVTDLNTTERLAVKIPSETVIVSESGINTFIDIRMLKLCGVDAFLIGEALIREEDIGKKLREFRGLGGLDSEIF